ncbi:alpha/beta-hydrolase [Thozetella sp. PMI_491]|nr:alpha/beta-hydrolase [Thozetella sp. PMI_491]
MFLPTAVLLALACNAFALSKRGQTSCNAELSVETTSGTLRGFINSTAPGTRQWLGVPYAEPPIGSLRFQPPKRFTRAGQLTTQAFKPSCKQQLSNSTSIYTAYEQQFLINGGDSEDCLYLNVYAPVKPIEAQVPVLLYIPGGGFTSGGSNSLYKIPDQWISRTQSHIVVTINYRVNLFGFPSARASFLNLGLLDQRLVVEWVYNNIAKFGGDPERITLWGQSAGAMSVSYYAYGFYYDPIVKGLIGDSGAASDATFDANHTSFGKLAVSVGCGGLDANAELACVQKVDANTLQELISTTSGLSFGVKADNVTHFANLEERAANGQPLLNGNNDNEGAGFSPATGQTQATWQVGLNAIVCPVSNQIALRAKNNLTTYRYYYAGNFSNISPQPWIGASHSAELPLIFGTHYEYRGNSTEFEWETDDPPALWLSFARNPSADPSGDGIRWPKYSTASNTTLYLAADGKVAQLISGTTVDSLCPSSTCLTCSQ